MKGNAMVIHRFGPPSEFRLEVIEVPDPGPGELLVRVIASGTNPVEAKLRANGAWANLRHRWCWVTTPRESSKRLARV